MPNPEEVLHVCCDTGNPTSMTPLFPEYRDDCHPKQAFLSPCLTSYLQSLFSTIEPLFHLFCCVLPQFSSLKMFFLTNTSSHPHISLMQYLGKKGYCPTSSSVGHRRDSLRAPRPRITQILESEVNRLQPEMPGHTGLPGASWNNPDSSLWPGVEDYYFN